MVHGGATLTTATTTTGGVLTVGTLVAGNISGTYTPGGTSSEFILGDGSFKLFSASYTWTGAHSFEAGASISNSGGVPLQISASGSNNGIIATAVNGDAVNGNGNTHIFTATAGDSGVDLYRGENSTGHFVYNVDQDGNLITSGTITGITTVWKDFAGSAFMTQSWLPVENYSEINTDDGEGPFMIMNVPYESGTVISQIRFKWGKASTANTNGIQFKLVKRLDSTNAATAWTTVGTLQSSTNTGGVTVVTYNIDDETMAANTTYALIVNAEVVDGGAEAIDVYSAGIETNKRVY